MRPLEPLFSAGCDHLGWIRPGEAVFGLEMGFLAYIAQEHAWSAETDLWLGAVDASTLLDPDGRPVAWSPAHPVKGSHPRLPPMRVVRPGPPPRPMRPIAPRRPLRPKAPLTGWSPLTFRQWLRLDAPPEDADASGPPLTLPPELA